jgi:hypothetical protein
LILQEPIPVNHTKTFNIPAAIFAKACVAKLGVAFVALASLVALASATTPVSAQAVNFGSINVCPSGKTTPAPCTANQTVTFNITAGTTIGSIAILTTGVPGLDFQAKAEDTSTALCKAQKYTSATTCTVDVSFAPLASGLRKGAVELLDDTKTLLAMNYVYGSGISPEIAFNPSSAMINLATPTFHQAGIAVDASGNIFVLNQFGTSNNSVVEYPVADHYATGKPLPSLPCNAGIAVDGAGNIFMAVIIPTR